MALVELACKQILNELTFDPKLVMLSHQTFRPVALLFRVTKTELFLVCIHDVLLFHLDGMQDLC